MYIYFKTLHLPLAGMYMYVYTYMHMCKYMLYHYPHLAETRTFIEVKHARASTAAYGCLYLLDASFLLFFANGGKT